MSWQEKNKVSLRLEFVNQAIKDESNITDLCERYNISRKTGYKWINRYLEGDSLSDLSKTPHNSPNKTSAELEEKILSVRREHPYWGPKKIKQILSRELPQSYIPGETAIYKILLKNNCINKKKTPQTHFQRFEHEAPNHLWQMDFKGHFEYEKGRCFPLTILDDHSRFSIKLHACSNERGETVKPLLIDTFRRYGLPMRINVDNGNPWGSLYEQARYTTLSVWLIRVGVTISYSAPNHPQTNGKDERFHRTLKLELLNSNYFKNLKHIQNKFDRWRDIYNQERPHEGINMQVPAERYYPSYRVFQDALRPIEYSSDYTVRKVDSRGRLSIGGRRIFVGIPFSQEPLGIGFRDSYIDIFYCHQKLGELNIRNIGKNSLTNLYSGKTLST